MYKNLSRLVVIKLYLKKKTSSQLQFFIASV